MTEDPHRWWPSLPDEQHPPVDAPLINTARPARVATGRDLVGRVARSARAWLVPGVVASAVIGLANVTVPIALGRVTQDGLIQRNTPALMGWLAVIVVVYALRSVFQTVRLRTNIGAARTEHDLRVQALNRVVSPQGLGGTPWLAGDILAVLITDVRAISRALIAFISIPSSAVALIGTLIAMAVMDWALVAGVAILVPLLVLLSVKGAAPVKAYTRAERRAEARAAGAAADLASGLRVIQGLAATRRASLRFRRTSREGLAATLRARRLKGAYTGVINASVGVFITLITILAAWLALKGRISVGDLVSAVGLVQTLGPPLRAIGVDTATALATAQASGDRFCELVEAPPAWHPGTRTSTPQPGSVDIRVDGVALPDGHRIDLHVPPGTHLGVVAPYHVTDALAAALSHPPGADPSHPEQGSQVRFDGIDASRLAPAALRGRVLVAPRNAELFDESALANLTSAEQTGPQPGSAAHDATSQARLEAVIRAAALDSVIETLPQGLETPVGEGGRQLSGGQRQRMALARALLRADGGLALVDPVTSVDIVTTATIASRMKTLRQGMTTVVAATSPALLAAMDEVVLLGADGTVLARGSHADLLAMPDYREMLS